LDLCPWSNGGSRRDAQKCYRLLPKSQPRPALVVDELECTAVPSKHGQERTSHLHQLGSRWKHLSPNRSARGAISYTMLFARRGLATMASLKKAGKVVCIGRNYACVALSVSCFFDAADCSGLITLRAICVSRSFVHNCEQTAVTDQHAGTTSQNSTTPGRSSPSFS